GIDACGKLNEVSADEWEQVVAVNLLGTVAVTRAALPHLRANGGTVVNCASTLGLRALGDARLLRLQVRGRGVHQGVGGRARRGGGGHAPGARGYADLLLRRQARAVQAGPRCPAQRTHGCGVRGTSRTATVTGGRDSGDGRVPTERGFVAVTGTLLRL